MSKLIERKSIRIYDPSIKITKQEMTNILEEATRAPSSMNMQPWRFVVVSSNESKDQLKKVLKGNHQQLETSAAMIVIFTDIKKYDYAEQIYNKAVEMNLMPEDTKEKQLRNISNMIPYLKDESIEKAGMIDGGIVAMNLMLVAREHGYDTCPIGGFDHVKIASTLGLDESRYKPVMIVSIGKKAEEGYQTVRLDVDDITYWM